MDTIAVVLASGVEGLEFGGAVPIAGGDPRFLVLGAVQARMGADRLASGTPPARATLLPPLSRSWEEEGALDGSGGVSGGGRRAATGKNGRQNEGATMLAEGQKR